MASDFVRNIKGVKNIDILSPNITTENDLISTTNGDVYVVTNKGYRKITNIETKDFEALKKQADTNTLNISDLTDEIDTLNTTTKTNTSDIADLKTTTETHTSDIETLNTTTEKHTSDISNLKTTTETNTSDIADLNTTTETNTTSIDDLLNEINTLKSNMLKHQVIYTGSANGTGSVLPLEDDIYDYKFIMISGNFPGGTFNQTVLISTLTGNIDIQNDNLRDSSGVFLGVYEIKIAVNTGTELEIVNDVSWDEAGSTGSGPDRNAYTITKIEGVK